MYRDWTINVTESKGNKELDTSDEHNSSEDECIS